MRFPPFFLLLCMTAVMLLPLWTTIETLFLLHNKVLQAILIVAVHETTPQQSNRRPDLCCKQTGRELETAVRPQMCCLRIHRLLLNPD